MQLNLTDDEREALQAFLRRLVDEARFPFAPALQPLRSILEKLDPPVPREPLPPLKPYQLGRKGPRNRDR